MRLEAIDPSTWESELPAEGFEIFHLPEALQVLDDHVDAELRLYGAYKGQNAVGLFPAFVEEKPLVRMATSPPPGLSVPRLGPLVMPTSPKQRKRESVNREFVELLVDELDADSRRSLLRVVCPLEYGDPRPFDWSGFRVENDFTYVLDLAGRSTDEVRSAFSSGLRRELRTLEEADVTVGVEGVDAALRVHEDVAARYAERGEAHQLPASVVRDLVESLGDRCRVYVARNGSGEYLGGIVALYSNDVASFWLGGVARSYEGASVNTGLHWEIIADVVEGPPVDGVWGYDLVGANTPRLCRYKSKFGADLVGYHTVESDGLGMSVAKQAYTLVNK